MSRLFYPLDAHEPQLWPSGNDVTGLATCDLGDAILDTGLLVTWGDHPTYWQRVEEPTSPRGTVWHLRTVCWLAVEATVEAPRPGLYAAFVRVRQPEYPLWQFSAEWKADATGRQGGGFLTRSPAREHTLRQHSASIVSWSHWRGKPPAITQPELVPNRWYLVHIGNIYVRSSYDGGIRVGPTNSDPQDVKISFGGENPYWCKNLEVDFAAIAPIRLSQNIESLVWAGHEQSQQVNDTHSGGGSSSATGGRTSAEPCLLSRIPAHVVQLILEFSQPTLVRPELGADPAEGGDGVHDGDDNSMGRWTVR